MRRHGDSAERAWRAARLAGLVTGSATGVGVLVLVPVLGVAAVAVLTIFAPAVPLAVMVSVEAVLRRLLPSSAGDHGAASGPAVLTTRRVA